MFSLWKNWWLSLFILIFVSRIRNVNGGSYYLVTASDSIYSGRTYGVAVSMFNSEKSTSCKVTLSGPDLDLKMQYNLTPQESIRSHQFQLPILQPGDYTLTVESVRGEYFKTSSQINWQSSTNFVKIQTPKTKYEPGEVFKFRALYFNENLKPNGPNSTSSIRIKDDRNNVVASYRKITLKDGVYRGKFQLANYPVLGRWSICTNNSNTVNEACAYFNVLEYVHSPYKVKLQMKRNVALTEKNLSVTVLSNYASENDVDGKCILYAESKLVDNHIGCSLKPIKLQLTSPIKKGKSLFTLDLTPFSNEIHTNMALKVYITAVINEGVNKTNVINLFKSPYNIECVQNNEYCSNLIANKENSFSFRITNLDGQIVNTKGAVKLIYTSALSKTYTFTSQLGKNGVVNFSKVKIPISNTNKSSTLIYKTEIVCQGVRQDLQDTTFNHTIIRQPDDMQNTESEIDIQPGLSEYITFDLDHKFAITTCVIMANGNVRAGYNVVPDIFNRLDAKIDFTADMGSSVSVYIYGVEGDTLYVAKKNILIKSERNQISIKAPKSVSPGQKISLSITTAPNSYVGVVGIDSSLFDLNDITNDLDVSQFNPPKNNSSPSLGLLTLTNAPIIKNAINAEISQIRTRKISKVKRKRKRSMFRTAPINHIRHSFSDIWIFDMLKSSSSGSNEWAYVVPDTITTWKLNAFSMNNKRGLSVISAPIYIHSSKKMYLSTSLPHSIKKGEILRIPVTCFNKQSENIKVTIKFRYYAEKMYLLNQHHQETENTDKVISIGPTDFGMAFYYIKPLENGELVLNFTATTSKFFDAIQHTLTVEGKDVIDIRSVSFIKSNHNQAIFNELPIKKMGIQQRTPKNLECLVTNQLTPITLQNLPIFNPFDNCEVLISKLLSCLYLRNYMKSQQLLNKTMSSRFQKCWNNGFQSLLRFRRPDGGFAYYALQDINRASCSSTWLTSYALRALQMLQKTEYSVDDDILIQATKFLLNRRRGKIHFKELCDTPTRKTLSDFQLTLEVFNVLKNSLARRDVLATLKWFKTQSKLYEWVAPTNGNYNLNWLDKRKALAAAGSLLLSKNNSQTKQYEVFGWVISELYGQYTRLNSYESSLAEEGVYEYLKRNPLNIHKFAVEIYDGSRTMNLSFNKPGDLNEQSIVLPNSVNSIQFRVDGLGQVLLQCGSLYNNEDFYSYSRRGYRRRYHLNITQEVSKQQLRLNLCMERFTENNENYMGTILELELPTGYILNANSLENMLSNDIVQQAIPVDKNTGLFVEFEPLLSNTRQCLSIEAKLLYKLDNLQPGKVMVYDVNAKQDADIFTYKVSNPREKV